MTNPKNHKKGLTVLSPEDIFRFDCRPGIACFTRCCRDISIFLSPYDIIRMKNALGLSSTEFLKKYTLTLIGDTGLPVVMLKMADNAEKTCPFLTDQGCSIYENRPWSCRIYPLQPESTKTTEKAQKQYYSVMDVPFCLGLKADKTASVKDWIETQGIEIYREMEALFKPIMTNQNLFATKITNPKIQDMFYMACYDLDRFKRFVLESSFLKIYQVDPEVVEKIKTDDVALYRLAMDWVGHGLIERKGLKIRPEIFEAKKQELGLK